MSGLGRSGTTALRPEDVVRLDVSAGRWSLFGAACALVQLFTTPTGHWTATVAAAAASVFALASSAISYALAQTDSGCHVPVCRRTDCSVRPKEAYTLPSVRKVATRLSLASALCGGVAVLLNLWRLGA